MVKDATSITEQVEKFYDKQASVDHAQVSWKKWELAASQYASYLKTPGKVLFPGCGRGEVIINLAKQKPSFEYYGIDLSKKNIEIEQKLAKNHNVRVDFKQGDYTETLPWPSKFQYIFLLDTLHHVVDSQAALNNIVHHQESNGLIYIHLYGKKCHQRRFEITEILDILQSVTRDGGERERFDLFMAHEKRKNSLKNRIMDFSLRQMWRALYQVYIRLKHRYAKNILSPAGTYNEFSRAWIAFYCHPNERTFDVLQTKELLTQAGLELIDIISIPKNPTLLPESWRSLFKKLDIWSQYRLLELYSCKGQSLILLAQKRP